MKNSADQGGCYPQRPKALLLIQNISPFLKELRHFAFWRVWMGLTDN